MSLSNEGPMVSILYNLCLFFGICGYSGYLIGQRIFLGKHKNNLWRRFYRLFTIKLPEPSLKPTIWMHCVSVGEVKASFPVVEKIRSTYPTFSFVISTVTMTGYEEARKIFPNAEDHFVLPTDFSWAMKKLVGRINPRILILSETDFWYHLLSEIKRKGGKVVVINGKISPSSLKKFTRGSFFAQKLFSLPDLFLVQSEVYHSAFRQLGVLPGKVHVTGNLKMTPSSTRITTENQMQLRNTLSITNHDFVITIASTHDKEEEILLRQLFPLWEKYSNLKIILAPRHLERLPSVQQIIQQLKLSYFLYSNREENKKGVQIILIDCMGMVCSLYQISKLAIVAGSYISTVGGHNIFEPIQVGIPVIYGPYMYGQQSLENKVKISGAGKTVPAEDLFAFIENYIENPQISFKMQKGAKNLFKEMELPLENTWKHLQPLLEASSK